MELRICLLIVSFLVACQGLKFTLNRDNLGTQRIRTICGVLICEENINASVASSSDRNHTHSQSVLKTIESMSIFNKGTDISGISGKKEDQRGFLLGSLTDQTPSLTQVANGGQLEGSLKPDRAILTVELVKQADCESEYSCQVYGKDSQGREVVTTANLIQQPAIPRAEPVHQGSLAPAVLLQVLTSIQQLAQSINGLENRVEDKVTSLENKIEDKVMLLESKVTSLENRMVDKVTSLENRIVDKLYTVLNSKGQLQKDEAKVEDKLTILQNSLEELHKKEATFEDKLTSLHDGIGHLQNNCTVESKSFENRHQGRLDLLENRIESEIRQNQLNTSLQLVPTELNTSCKDAKEEIVKRLDSIQETFSDVQKETLKKVSERFEKTMNNATFLLGSMAESLDSRKCCDRTAELTARNETRDILEKLTSGEVSVRCVSNETADQHRLYQQPLKCSRDMGKTRNQSYPQYITMTQSTLNRKILCDTKTDGGGWTVILRRVKGDLNFNRDWVSYKNGFGNLAPDEDFWLGNEAVHILTYFRTYELRIELTSEGKEYIHVYKTFKLENEANKYTLRLGAGTGSIVNGIYGLSYSNNAAFSTFDQDNDSWPNNCAVSRKCGWWYKKCSYSKLTTPWHNGRVFEAWHTGKKWMHATRVEMKIRPLKSG